MRLLARRLSSARYTLGEGWTHKNRILAGGQWDVREEELELFSF